MIITVVLPLNYNPSNIQYYHARTRMNKCKQTFVVVPSSTCKKKHLLLFPLARVNIDPAAVLRHHLCQWERHPLGHRPQLKHQRASRARPHLCCCSARLQSCRAHSQMCLLQISTHMGMAHHGKTVSPFYTVRIRNLKNRFIGITNLSAVRIFNDPPSCVKCINSSLDYFRWIYVTEKGSNRKA